MEIFTEAAAAAAKSSNNRQLLKVISKVRKYCDTIGNVVPPNTCARTSFRLMSLPRKARKNYAKSIKIPSRISTLHKAIHESDN